jgi:uncharacterized protein involved in exopolysaccharide biosynthesis
MTYSNNLQQTALTLFKAFQSHRALWIVPTVAMTAIALLYAIVRPTEWKASQALVVRDEAGGTLTRQGRFDSIDSMKAFQETILEVARSSVVVTGTLKQLGPATNVRDMSKWPTDKDVKRLQGKIKVAAPQGAEFGRTEVIYLSVVGGTRAEAIARTSAVCDHLERHLGGLRNARAGSVINELAQTLKLAASDLDAASERLQSLEREVGTDLRDLRALNQPGSGESTLQIALNQVASKLREEKTNHELQQQLRNVLERAKDNPEELLAMPAKLIESQPALRRMKDGLVDAQLRTSDLRGRMSPGHPLVRSAIQAEQAVRTNLRSEVDSVLLGLNADIEVSQRQTKTLERQHDELQARFDRLASLRARYAVLVDDVRQRTEIVEKAKKDIADARGSRTAAQSASLITRFQTPQAGDTPIGPSRATILAAGLLGGLMTGAGLVFLVAPLGPNSTGRRWSDYLPFGRRAADRGQRPVNGENSPSRRAEDPATASRSSDGEQSRRAEDRTQAPNAERRSRRRRTEDQ